MPLDPFSDYKTAGYLRNTKKLPLGRRLKAHEHKSFLRHLPEAIADLSKHKQQPGYEGLLAVHRMLFCDIYPWAGLDRLATMPDKIVKKGDTEFAKPHQLRRAFSVAMDSKTPGQVLGNLAYCHPFLEGNGRAIFTFFDDWIVRKSMQLEWVNLEEGPFLIALDKQIKQPDGDAMDELLDPHISVITTGSRPRSTLLDVTWNQRKPK